jgi:hypothetical protein
MPFAGHSAASVPRGYRTGASVSTLISCWPREIVIRTVPKTGDSADSRCRSRKRFRRLAVESQDHVDLLQSGSSGAALGRRGGGPVECMMAEPGTILTPAVLFLATVIRSAFGFGGALVAVPLSAGVLGGAYGMNGPPLVIYGSLRGSSPQHFRATLQGYFFRRASRVSGATGLPAFGLQR